MTTTARSIGSFQRPARAPSAWRRLQREALAFWKMVSDTPTELRGLADDFDANRPVSARQLREAARRAWGFDL